MEGGASQSHRKKVGTWRRCQFICDAAILDNLTDAEQFEVEVVRNFYSGESGGQSSKITSNMDRLRYAPHEFGRHVENTGGTFRFKCKELGRKAKKAFSPRTKPAGGKEMEGQPDPSLELT